MTEKELRKLNRYELLEMLLAQGKKLERLERELAEANERLAQRQQIVATSGTMAEAAMRLNRVFEDSESAAREYLCILYTSPSLRAGFLTRMPSHA